MAVDPRLRKKKRKKGSREGSALMLNIRVRHIRKKGAPETSKTTVRDALQTLLDTGRMPRGWQFMYVDWKNPSRYGSSWASGWPSGKHADDPEEFLHAFEKVVQDQIRMAAVRKIPRGGGR